ncbi:MAG: Ig-like domain-containing protein [Acidobacteriota bacterium]
MNMKTIGRAAARALYGLPLLLAAVASAQPTEFFTATSCRLFDSRTTTPLVHAVVRDIPVSGVCAVPPGTTAVALNFTALGGTTAGNISVYSTGSTPSSGATRVNFLTSIARANNGVVALGTNGQISALATLNGGGSNTVQFVIDLSGYFLADPVAADDSYPASFQTSLTVPAPGVLSNDTLRSATIVSYGATTGTEQTTIGTATPTSAAGGSVTLNADGSLSYTPPASFIGDDTFKYILQNAVGSSIATVTFQVGKANQTISFTSSAPAGAQVGGATYTVTATATSGLTVGLTIDASASSVCTISGSTVSFIGIGSCVIDANQAGDTNWNAAPQVQQSFAVAKGDQTISFTSTAPASAKVGGATYAVTGTATSGLAVTFTIDATATAVCSISGSTVSFLTVGTCVIDANQAGDVNWNAAPQAQQSFAVGKGDQTIGFTSTAPAGATVGGPTYTVTATATSGLAVTFTIDATATTVCSISGSTVSFLAAGTCVIDANQAGDANWNAAPQAQQSFTVGKAAQTINFTTAPPSGAVVGGPTYTVGANATPSGLPVTLTIDASASSVCSIAGSTVAFIGFGTCVIDANQPGDANYNAATQVQQSFTVIQIHFQVTPATATPTAGTAFNVTVTAQDQGNVTYTAYSGTVHFTSTDAQAVLPGDYTFVGGDSGVHVFSVTLKTSGSESITVVDTLNAIITGTANVTVAPGPTTAFTVSGFPSPTSAGVSHTFTVTAKDAFGNTTPAYIGTAHFTSPDGLATLPGDYTFVAIDAGAHVFNATLVTVSPTQSITATDTVTASITGTQSPIIVNQGSQTINFTSTAPVGATVGGPTYSVTATATPSGLPVAFTIDPSATSVCSIAGSTVTMIGAGTCVINANQAGNANYSAAAQVQQSFSVAKGDQTISFTSTAPSPATAGGPTYNVTATATSGLAVTFTIDGTATSVCSIAGSTVSFLTSGTCVIDANQPGNSAYNAAPQVQQSFLVVKQDQTISFTSTPPANATNNGPTYAVTATATSGLTVTFTIDGTATSICSISGSTVSFLTGGTCVIDANQAGNATFNPAPQVQQSFHVNQGPVIVASPKENFDTVGGVQLEFKAAPSLTTPEIFVAGNLVANFTDPDGPSPLAAVAFSGATVNGGTVTIATNGEFLFTPKTADPAATDTFPYSVTDSVATVTRTVTVNLKSRAWFVKNNAAAGGLGRSQDPFDTLAEAQTASLAGDYIFVYGGDLTTTGQAAGIVLKANQKFYGEAFGLTIANTINGVVNPTLVAATPANRPLIDNPAASGNAVGITNITGVEVRGFSITANTNAINVTTTAAGSGSATISGNVITGSGQQGIKVVAGGTGGAAVAIQNNSVSATGNGIDARTTAGATLLDVDNETVVSAASGIFIDGSGGGTTTITAFANNVVSGTTAGSGILVTSAKFDAVSGGGYDQVSGGTTAVGVSGNGVGGSGLVLTSVSGDLAFTDLDVFADGGAAVRVSGTGAVNVGAGTGTRVTVGTGVATFEAIGGPAVDVASATINLQPTSVKSTNSATTGVALNSVLGTFSAGSGSSITGSTGTGFQVGSSNATISYDGTINVSAGKGVDLTSNTGSTIGFTGTLTFSSGSNTAFNATGGGTVTATDTTSTLTTTTGTALNVANTTIGASGLKFRSISAGTAVSGPTNGIVLNNTGASGSLTVAGTGTPGSGGTIRKCGIGISLTSTLAPSFARMQLNDFSDFAIRGNTVSGFTLTDSVINGVNGDNDVANEGSVSFDELTGSATLTNVNISGGWEDNVRLLNTTGTLNRLTITNCTIGANSASFGNAALNLQAAGTAAVNVTVTGSTFTGSRSHFIQYLLNGSSTPSGDLVLTANGFTQSMAAIAGAGDIFVSSGGNGNPSLTYNIQGNTMRNAVGNAINVSKGAGTGTFSGTIDGNVIGVTGVANSGSAQGNGIAIIHVGGGTHTTHVTNNTIRRFNNDGILVQVGDNTSGGNGTVNVTATGNSVKEPDSFALHGMELNVGTTAGDTHFVCASVGGAGALKNDVSGAGVVGNGGFDLRPRQRQSTTIRLPGYGGAFNDTSAVATFLAGQNTTGGVATISASVASNGFVNGAACP